MLRNEYRIEGDVAYVMLTQGKESMVDLTDLPKLSGFRWYASFNPAINGWYVNTGSRNAAGKNTTLYLHRHLMDAPKGQTVDHINHDTLDNRRANLRLISNQANCENRKGAYKSSKTGIRGVTVHKCKPSGLMYSANVQVKGKHHAKYFPYTPEGLERAAHAVEEMRRELMSHSTS